ncbi:MAG: bacteriohemerythrin [Zoogloeaceae bacterium]|nr:bacteriohemerythrin [Zoogloeaceae bacterium]
MPYIEWDNSLSVGVEVIDEQHMRIVDYINEIHDTLHAPMTVSDREERVMQVVNSAIDYTESHFDFEEDMLEKVNYPYLKAHTRVHQLFVRRIHDYKTRLENGEDIARELMDTLMHWLLNHIRSEDKNYAKWMSGTDERSLP